MNRHMNFTIVSILIFVRIHFRRIHAKQDTHWRITYSLTNGAINNVPDILGYCTVDSHLGRAASIQFVERLVELPDKEREWYILHELLHIVFNEADTYANTHLHEDYREWFRRLVESRTSEMATALMEVSGERESE